MIQPRHLNATTSTREEWRKSSSEELNIPRAELKRSLALDRVAALLVEVFEACSEFDHLQAINQTGDRSVPFTRPAYEVYLGARVLATYAAHRNRPHFLRELLPRYVQILQPRRFEEMQAPFLFWPFRGSLELPDMKLGRNQEYWQQQIEETWGQVFGSEEGFLESAAQLEFILEL